MIEFLTAPRPIRSVLIANRGEIAVRIIRTCRRLGLRSIAVHSEADRDALHVRMADQALCIGPPAPADSYLDIASVIAAARQGGADAVHPGYGFLSENADFVRACEAAGLIFVGPDPAAVEAMGSKIEARRIARDAAVPVVPGFDARGADLAALVDAAAAIGYPVMVKASAGGGGRGMRRVERPEDLAAALASARAEAGAAFGDDTLFIEKLILRPRHIEVQVFGDGQGNAVHFHERDCSVQRNHQKLIEEAPAPNLSPELRARLFDSALSLTRAIRYAGAGTIEFILQQDSTEPYFLEMNTRLQVEHPVTEAICGVDLVEWQFRQAAGLPLPLAQDQIVVRGHAIEVRLNAERPEAGFLPATGTCLDVVAPPGLRFDSGVAAGSVVGSHYDSLLAKLISWAPDRDGARRQLVAGLRQMALPGIATNQAFLADCLETAEFAEGRATTDFLAENFPAGWQPDATWLLALRGAAALALLPAADSPHLHRDGFRVTARHGARGGRIPLALTDDYGSAELVLRPGPVPQVQDGARTLDLLPDKVRTWRAPDGDSAASLGGLCVTLQVRPLAEARMSAASGGIAQGEVLAPLTGLVTEVFVQPGDRVEKGAPLLVMEAMKLVHMLPAPLSGRVVRVACAPGDTLSAKTVLVEIEETD